MDDLPSRSVIREEAFEDELHVLIRDAETADEYTAAAETLLACDPTAGMPVPGAAEVWALPMSPVGGKTVWLLYSFDAETVLFLGLRTV